jgi:hypothetical protein
LVKVAVRATDGFETVHDAALRLASLDEEREREHEFTDDEEVIDCVDRSYFEGSISLGDVYTGEKDCRVVEEEVIVFRDEFEDLVFSEGGVFGSEGEVEGHSCFFYLVDERAGVFIRCVVEVAFGGRTVNIFIGTGVFCVSSLFVGKAVVVACSCDEWCFAELGVNEVKWKIGCAI